MSLIPTSFFNGHHRTNNTYDPYSIDLWDAFNSRQLCPSSSPFISPEVTQLINTHVDWVETPESHIFKADLPGLRKDEVKVEVEERWVLQISGERRKENEEKTGKWHCVERSCGKFIRRFRLPENAKIGEIKASMENGVLTVIVPKMVERIPQTKQVKIAAG